MSSPLVEKINELVYGQSAKRLEPLMELLMLDIKDILLQDWRSMEKKFHPDSKINPTILVWNRNWGKRTMYLKYKPDEIYYFDNENQTCFKGCWVGSCLDIRRNLHPKYSQRMLIGFFEYWKPYLVELPSDDDLKDWQPIANGLPDPKVNPVILTYNSNPQGDFYIVAYEVEESLYWRYQMGYNSYNYTDNSGTEFWKPLDIRVPII